MEFTEILEMWLERHRKENYCPFDFIRCSESCGILFPKFKGHSSKLHCPCILYGVNLVELRVRYFLRYNK